MAAYNKLNVLFSFTTLLFTIFVTGQDLGPISDDDGFIAESPNYIPLQEVEAAEAPEVSDIPRDINVGFLKTCVESSTPKCGKEVYNALFSDLAVGEECCLQLYYILGKTCHDRLVKAVLARPENKDKATKVLPKSKQVWDTCALLASNEFGALAPGIAFDDDDEDLQPSAFDDIDEDLQPSTFDDIDEDLQPSTFDDIDVDFPPSTFEDTDGDIQRF